MSAKPIRTIVVVVVSCLAVAAAVYLLTWHSSAISTIGIEGYKLLLQFVMIVVLGGAITLLYQAFNRKAEERTAARLSAEQQADNVRTLRQDYMTQLIGEYNRTKQARRLIRARALVRPNSSGKDHVKVAEYDKEMQAVLDAQLTLETIAYAVRAEPELFPEGTSIRDSVKAMEEYLHTLVSEYEEHLPNLPIKSSLTPLDTLPALKEFIGPYQSSTGFRQNFVHRFHAALSDLQLLLISRPRIP
jgi:hypothetical protein